MEHFNYSSRWLLRDTLREAAGQPPDSDAVGAGTGSLTVDEDAGEEFSWVEATGESYRRTARPTSFHLWRFYGLVGWLAPVAILVVIAVILTGQLLDVYGLVLVYDFADGGNKRERMSGYTIFENVEYIWKMDNFGLKLFAILIFVFSLLWPHFKLLCLLFLWFTPGRWVPSRTRQQWMYWLNQLTTYSLFDVFLVMLLEVAVRIPLRVTPNGDTIEIELAVAPGGYVYATGTILSLILGHIIGLMEVYAAHTTEDSPAPPRKRKLLLHQESTLWVQVCYPVFMSLGMILFTIGQFIYCFKVEYNDEWEDVIGHKIMPVSYSLFGMARTLLDTGSRAGGIYVFIVFFLFVTLTVFARMVTTYVFFYHPLSFRRRQECSEVFEWFHAWSALDVFLWSVFLMSLIIGVMVKHFLSKITDMDNPVTLTPRAGFFVLIVAQTFMIFAQCISIREQHICMKRWFTDKEVDPLFEQKAQEMGTYDTMSGSEWHNRRRAGDEEQTLLPTWIH